MRHRWRQQGAEYMTPLQAQRKLDQVRATVVSLLNAGLSPSDPEQLTERRIKEGAVDAVIHAAQAAERERIRAAASKQVYKLDNRRYGPRILHESDLFDALDQAAS